MRASSIESPTESPSTGIVVRARFRRGLRVRTAWLCLALGIACGSQIGCVHRRMTIRSDPPGALVLLEGDEIGYTPVSIDFTYYGTREITLVKPGYETLSVMQEIPTPWYQRTPVEFFADNFSPVKITNRFESPVYTMQRQMVVTNPELLQRANGLRTEAQIAP